MIRNKSSYLFIFFVIFALDRLSKYCALRFLTAGVPQSVFFGLEYLLSFNRGISWGLLSFEQNRYFYIISFFIVAVVLAFACLTMRDYQKNHHVLGEIMVLGGALSNLLDRVLHHGVVDFIHVTWPIDWPIFNLADFFIVTGVIVIFFKQRQLL